MKRIFVVVVTFAVGVGVLGCDKKVAENSSSSLGNPGQIRPTTPTQPTATSTGTQDQPGSAAPPSTGGGDGLSPGGRSPQ